LDNRKGVCIETKCARLFLMSDVLFNSQQPGVKNAFRYRDAIEQMAPDVFKCLGQHGNGNVGRITMNKLRSAVLKVLNAWDSWSVYNGIFLDQLEALFEGKPLPEPVNGNAPAEESGSIVNVDDPINVSTTKTEVVPPSTAPTSIWMDASNIAPRPMNKEDTREVDTVDDGIDGELFSDNEIDPESLIDEELDGESLGDSEIADSDYEEANEGMRHDD